MAIVYRHNRITRLTHWIDAVALMILLYERPDDLQCASAPLLGQYFPAR